MIFTLASGNAHKAKEFAGLFPSEVLEVTVAPRKIEVVEDGLTFRENALKKAKAYFDELAVPVMSDDSGLVVSALPNELGIHTARFGGEGLSATERNDHLLKRLADLGEPERDAYFICVLCFYLSPQEFFFFEGRLNGKISTVQLGSEGFGYDPIFLPNKAPEGRSLAEIPDWKEQNSHRALACKAAIKFFQERIGQN